MLLRRPAATLLLFAAASALQPRTAHLGAAGSLADASFAALGGGDIMAALEARCRGGRGRERFRGDASAHFATSAADAEALYATAAAARAAKHKLEGFVGASLDDAVLDAAADGEALDASALVAAADATAAVDAAGAWAAGIDNALGPLTRDLVSHRESAVCRGLARAFEVEDGARVPVLDDASCAPLRAARKRVAAAQRTLAAAVAERRVENPQLFELEKHTYVVSVAGATPPKKLGRKVGASRSGKSSYVEPAACAAAADAVRDAERDAAAAETARLRELAAGLGARAAPLRACLESLAAVDCALARADLGDAWRGAPADVRAESLELFDARHPLLALRGDCRPLRSAALARGTATVVSGPNGGGKTVALKTFGLLALLAAAGVDVPARKANVPVFPAVLADVDGSSRAAFPGNSTYEAHLRFVAAAARRSGCLVIMDELGGGTDHAEGAAVARATLEKLSERGGAAVCATHHGALKALAGEPGFASLAFRVDGSGSPTFDAVPGAPGRSDALAAASRCGVPDAVLDRARAILDAGPAAAPAEVSDELWAALDGARRDAERAEAAALDARRDAELAAEAVRRELAKATADALKRATRARKNIEARERRLEALFQDLRRAGGDAVSVVGDTIAAARVARRASQHDARDALLAAHGLAPPPSVAPGDRLVLVAHVDPETGDVTTLAGDVSRVDGDDVAFETAVGQVVDCKVADLATWAVPVLADGRPRDLEPEDLARTLSLARTPAAVGGRAARYLDD